MEETPTLFAAFGAGFCSLVSPGAVALLPGFAGFLRGRGVGHVLVFLLGYSLVFVALGASASAPGQFLLEHLPLAEGAAGVFLLAVGLRGMGMRGLKRRESTDPVAEPGGAGGLLVALLAGGALTLGWTPLAGIVLSRILAISTAVETIGAGVTLLAAYALGRALSMLGLGLAQLAARRMSQRSRSHERRLDMIAGALVAITGLLIVTGTMPILAALLSDYLPLF